MVRGRRQGLARRPLDAGRAAPGPCTRLESQAVPTPPAMTTIPESARWIVLKFGGTSVSQRERWDTIGRLAASRAAGGRRVLVVVSALSGEIGRASCRESAQMAGAGGT